MLWLQIAKGILFPTKDLLRAMHPSPHCNLWNPIAISSGTKQASDTGFEYSADADANAYFVYSADCVDTRPINADTNRAPYLPNGKTYELQTWYMDGGRRPTSATGAMTSKVKG